MALRLADAGDFAALERMLLEAVNWSPDREPLTLEQLREHDMLVRYVEGWPRDGDAGVIARKLVVSWELRGFGSSVAGNRAVRLYRYLGFVVVFEKNSSYTMRLRL